MRTIYSFDISILGIFFFISSYENTDMEYLLLGDIALRISLANKHKDSRYLSVSGECVSI
jgi:hypothetical protein